LSLRLALPMIGRKPKVRREPLSVQTALQL